MWLNMGRILHRTLDASWLSGLAAMVLPVLVLGGCTSPDPPAAKKPEGSVASVAPVSPGALLGRLIMDDGREIDVPFEDADRFLAGALTRGLAELDSTTADALATLCIERTQEHLGRSQGKTLDQRLEQLWELARPGASEVQAYLDDNAANFPDGPPPLEMITQLLTLAAFEKLEAEGAAARLVQGSDERGLYARVLRDPAATVARCGDTQISGGSVLEHAGPALLTKRQSFDELSCSLFQQSAASPLVSLHAGEGIQPIAAEPELEEVLKAAGADLHEVDERAMERARKRLHERNLARSRRELLQERIDEIEVECLVSIASVPTRSFDREKGDADVVYYGAVSCPLCTPGRAMLARLRAADPQSNLTFDWQHNIEYGFAPQFLEAVAIECARDQQKLWIYLEQRFEFQRPADDAAEKAGIDVERFQTCRRGAKAAITVLQSSRRSQRLGFAGAIPSWTIGPHLLRGWRSEEGLGKLISEHQVEMDAN